MDADRACALVADLQGLAGELDESPPDFSKYGVMLSGRDDAPWPSGNLRGLHALPGTIEAARSLAKLWRDTVPPSTDEPGLRTRFDILSGWLERLDSVPEETDGAIEPIGLGGLRAGSGDWSDSEAVDTSENLSVRFVPHRQRAAGRSEP